MVAVEADGGVRPLPADGVTTEHAQTQVGEEGDRGLEVPHRDTDVLELDGHTSTLPTC